MKFSVKGFFSKFDQIRIFLRVWSHLLKKSLMENFIFCAVLILMENFNMTTSNSISSQFLDTFVLSPVNVNSTCFKNSKNPSCIDLLPTNFKPSVMKTNFFETGISDHHKMISNIMKHHFTRESPKTSYYRG